MAHTTAARPDAPRSIDPTFDLLDRAVALDGADDPLLQGPVPEAPLLDGRPVEDPRLIAALSVPHVFSRAELLDRAAKLGGVLRVLGADGATALILSRTLPHHVRTFAVLAGLRIGVLVVDEAIAGPSAPAADPETLTLRPRTDGEQEESGDSALRTAVRSVPSHVEGIVVEGGGQVRDLDRLMRDSRIEPAPSRPRPADRPALVVDGSVVALADAAPHITALLDSH